MSVHLDEHLTDIIGDDISLILCLCLEDIESDRVFSIGEVEVDQIVYPLFGDIFEDMFTEITMWIDETESITERDVLLSHRQQCSGFTCTCLSDDIEVSKPIDRCDSNLFLHSSIVIVSEEYSLGRDIVWCGHDFEVLSSDTRITIKLRVREMD